MSELSTDPSGRGGTADFQNAPVKTRTWTAAEPSSGRLSKRQNSNFAVTAKRYNDI